LGVVLYLEKSGKIDLYHKNAPQESTPQNSINYSPPTKEESSAGDKQKATIVKNSNADTSTPSSQDKTAEVIIVDASQYSDVVEVRAFVANHIEDGTCTYTFTKDNSKIVKTEPANADASTTPCITLDIPKSEFKLAGTWNLVVDYISTSAGISGTSSKTVEVAL